MRLHTSSEYIVWLSLVLGFTVAQLDGLLPIKFANRSYGPDGPWNVIRVYVGTPPQQIDVHLGAQTPTIFLSSQVCTNATGAVASRCLEEAGGVYNQNASSTVNTESVDSAVTNWQSPLNQTGSGTIVSDTLAFTTDGQTQARNTTIQVVNSSNTTLPNGSSYPVSLGVLSMGGIGMNQTFNTSRGQVQYNTPENFLSQQGNISSESLGFHLGSASVGPPGSLVLGGYDQSRVLGAAAAQSYNTSGPFMTIDLHGMWFGVAAGYPSPVGDPHARPSINLTESGGHLNVRVSPDTPYMYLPRATCDAMVYGLPAYFNEAYGLYFWNTSDPMYEKIIHSASFLGFVFRTAVKGGGITIRVSFMLLTLTLDEPIISPPVAYFPCYPVKSDFTLGRAFLQAAFLGINWQPLAPPGTWFLAQAPGPSTQSTPDYVKISETATTIGSSDARWIDTWRDVFPPIDQGLSGNSSVSNATQASHGKLSSGSQAAIGAVTGIVIATFLAVLALLVVRRRRRQRRAQQSVEQDGEQKKPELNSDHNGVVEKDDSEQICEAGDSAAAEMQSSQVHEAPSSPAHEMQDTQVYEVHGDGRPEPATEREVP